MNDSETLIDQCVNCGEHSNELINNFCSNCLEPSEFEIADLLIRENIRVFIHDTGT